jgi:hypothetical protein
MPLADHRAGGGVGRVPPGTASDGARARRRGTTSQHWMFGRLCRCGRWQWDGKSGWESIRSPRCRLSAAFLRARLADSQPGFLRSAPRRLNRRAWTRLRVSPWLRQTLVPVPWPGKGLRTFSCRPGWQGRGAFQYALGSAVDDHRVSPEEADMGQARPIGRPQQLVVSHCVITRSPSDAHVPPAPASDEVRRAYLHSPHDNRGRAGATPRAPSAVLHQGVGTLVSSDIGREHPCPGRGTGSAQGYR